MIELRTISRAAPPAPIDDDWREQAACAGMIDDTFFPISRNDPATAAKAICRRCPVIEKCLELGLVTGSDGVLGGMTAVERDQLKRRRRPVVA